MKVVSSNEPFTLVQHLTPAQRERVLNILRAPDGGLIVSVLQNYALHSAPTIPLFRESTSAEDMYRRALIKERTDAMREFIGAIESLRVLPEEAKKDTAEDEETFTNDALT